MYDIVIKINSPQSENVNFQDKRKIVPRAVVLALYILDK